MAVVATDPGPWLASVRRSHDRLTAEVVSLGASDLERPSYCSEWSIAQALSHLGSQAEIVSLFVEAGLTGGDAPTREAFEPIWAAWNARTPEAQASDSLATNEALVARLEGLDPEALATFRLNLFGMDLDAAGLLRMRLSEHAVRVWDVAAALDSAARIAPDAVELLVEDLSETAARAGTSAGRSFDRTVGRDLGTSRLRPAPGNRCGPRTEGVSRDDVKQRSRGSDDILRPGRGQRHQWRDESAREDHRHSTTRFSSGTRHEARPR
jgi:uncharacterized protein (TIGR03083 family)